MSGRGGSLSSRARGEVGRATPWRLVVEILVIVVIIGMAWWIWPRDQGEIVVAENVRFDYQMMFTYYSSDENVPLDNIRLDWSAPKVDNEYVGQTHSIWELYYLEDDNTLTRQAWWSGTMGVLENLRGDRTSLPQMYEYGYASSEYGPVFSAWFDRLYPREVFLDVGYFTVAAETADEVTLKVYGQTDSVAMWWAYGQENQGIDFSFWVGLWRENVLVEKFEWAQENATHASYWLWPVT